MLIVANIKFHSKLLCIESNLEIDIKPGNEHQDVRIINDRIIKKYWYEGMERRVNDIKYDNSGRITYIPLPFNENVVVSYREA